MKKTLFFALVACSLLGLPQALFHPDAGRTEEDLLKLQQR